jgi:hypothetical protein
LPEDRCFRPLEPAGRLGASRETRKSEIQICVAEIIAVSLRLPVRQQGRVEHDETRVRGFKLPAILKEADRERRPRDGTEPLAKRDPVLAVYHEVARFGFEVNAIDLRKMPSLQRGEDDAGKFVGGRARQVDVAQAASTVT